MNNEKLGYFKDELNGIFMTKFIGLSSKCYSFQTTNQKEDQNKAKGIKKSVTSALKMSEYEQCVDNVDLCILKSQRVIRSRAHEIFTENLTKVALNGRDNKRYLLSDSYSTLALGHKKIESLELNMTVGEN